MGRRACLLLLLASCGRASEPAQAVRVPCGEGAHELATVVDPGLEEGRPPWDGAETTAEWLDEGCLRIRVLAEERDTAWADEGGTLWHEQLVSVSFSPPAAPRVWVREWLDVSLEGEERSWTFWDVQGSARVSTDGTGLGRPDGPDLVVAYEFTGLLGSSLEKRSGGVRLTDQQLRRP